ncbi:ankyrin repeat domain-containing protein [Paraburkholderia sp. C35]|uniref:ankyrin repeat domain-containing protein n=1 Tax=Paraburkholderia sp. C35 TaxID=2126993 RepID=UPI000D685723|nr:ankyrin repeat domain-containing protein [Paraburkholderia sp. C35]
MSNIPLAWLPASQQETDYALIGAVQTGSTGVVERLLAAGADPKAQRPSGWANGHVLTPLNIAAAPTDRYHTQARAAILGMLLDHASNAFTQEEKDGALGIAIGSGADAVRVLLNHGANPNAKREDGTTSLHQAIVAHSDPEIVTLLLDAGADIDERDESQNAPLRMAIELGRARVVRLLLDRGADVHVTHSPDNHVSRLATEGGDIWSMLVLEPRTGPFRQRFEEAVMAGHSATLKELLTQRAPGDDLSDGIPDLLDRAYMWTSGNRGGDKVKSPSQWWAEARRCVRALVKAGALDRTISHHYGNGSNLTIPAWFNTVRPEIQSGVAEFERTASTLSALFIKEEERALRAAISTIPVTAARATRARL